ncbi:Nucleotidylyl transferase [Coemansia reversa NRRL 1564]|uniref:Nucleotidylyl transferase n=1 Tax=Coemansia reversa (strain ATCC 12441 / NRRL 1564) TaxID=763665 RepID=A0A2G5BCP1_COERN|nr:Nucleotidylyl transferase [Coemansia reversa NRRL 1564]|eukprot:PIA16780.1 Nucleotidylyl transferase [Coemansia reversa NRRL 1564]
MLQPKVGSVYADNTIVSHTILLCTSLFSQPPDHCSYFACITLSGVDLSILPEWWPSEMRSNVIEYTSTSTLSSRISAVTKENIQQQSTRTATPWPSYSHVAVGGTFDHLHVGHKILLTATALAATKRVVCGISADALLVNKKYKELLEPYRMRELNVLLFLRKIRKDLIVELAPLYDPYGPTASDASIEALVVSQETLQSANALNVRRRENDMPPMHLMSIDLLATTRTIDNSISQDNLASVSLENTPLKISSTAIRAALAQKQKRLLR